MSDPSQDILLCQTRILALQRELAEARREYEGPMSEELHDAHAALRRQHGLIEQLWRYAAHRRGCARVMLIEVDKEPPCDCGFDEICAVLDAHNKTPVIRRAMGEEK